MIETLINTDHTEIDRAKSIGGQTGYVRTDINPIGTKVHVTPITKEINENWDKIKKGGQLLINPIEILEKEVKEWRGRGIVYVPKKYVGEHILIIPIV